jgi:hypothetical protein
MTALKVLYKSLKLEGVVTYILKWSTEIGNSLPLNSYLLSDSFGLKPAFKYTYQILALGCFCVIFYILFPLLSHFTFSMPGLAEDYEIMHFIIFLLYLQRLCALR